MRSDFARAEEARIGVEEMIDVNQYSKEIIQEQPKEYILGCLLRLIIKDRRLSDADATELLDSIKGGWFYD